MAKYFMATFVGLLFSGCASSPPTQYFVLEPIKQKAFVSAAMSPPMSIGIGPVAIPALLARKKIVTHSADNTVQIAEYHQWATPLENSLPQTIASNIAALQPNNIVRTYPWSIHGIVDLQVVVEISRFDTSPGKCANLEANWSIKNEANHQMLKSGRSVFTQTLKDTSYPGTVRALSDLIGQFSQDLSSVLLEIGAKHKD